MRAAIIRCVALAGAAAALVACAGAPAPQEAAASAPQSNEDKVIAAIAANGCVMTMANMTAVTEQTGLTDSELAEVGAALEASGRADVSTFGEFRLTTGPCA